MSNYEMARLVPLAPERTFAAHLALTFALVLPDSVPTCTQEMKLSQTSMGHR